MPIRLLLAPADARAVLGGRTEIGLPNRSPRTRPCRSALDDQERAAIAGARRRPLSGSVCLVLAVGADADRCAHGHGAKLARNRERDEQPADEHLTNLRSERLIDEEPRV